jgi:maltose phosphorylase
MISLFLPDEWKISINEFVPEYKRLTESIFSIGNGHMGLRGFFEEKYSGDSLQGTYIAGIYYPDKTKVGWWKNGFTDSFAKVVNATNLIGCNIIINGKALDLNLFTCENFKMELDMQTGLLTRSFLATAPSGEKTSFIFKRFLSMANKNVAVVSISAKPINFTGTMSFEPYLDGDVSNEDSNYDKKFWTEINRESTPDNALLILETLKTQFQLSTAMSVRLLKNGDEVSCTKHTVEREKYVGQIIDLPVKPGITYELQKYISVCTSRDYDKPELFAVTLEKLEKAERKGYNNLFSEHRAVMAQKWSESDIAIDGDVKAQQGIRYNIFQLNQTYTGEDPRLNIGPKGFTGEKYGGSTYWDTEAICLPFYLYTNSAVARNLLYYRYLHLEKAKENAERLGLKGALYPMVTMDGEECHNEWEITFEELHRNGAIAYAIYNYTNYTGDESYLEDYGIEEIVEISRFYADRVSYQPKKGKYMILGVTGPNEYENNVNNNWYTNTLAAWVMEYALSSLEKLQKKKPQRYAQLLDAVQLKGEETEKWQDIIKNMYYPYVKELDIFEQQDLYMDKEQRLVESISKNELPLNKHWSWDRILRSCFIKQADVIQAFYFFPDRYDRECKRRNFDFYEPRTVHESSLSPSVYSIVASQIGYRRKAYELYVRTSRLDIDNYNDDTDDGVHITSMAGSWLAIVQGFAGIYVSNGALTMRPYVPDKWNRYCFNINFRGSKLDISVGRDGVKIRLAGGNPLDILVYDRKYRVESILQIELEQDSSIGDTTC